MLGLVFRIMILLKEIFISTILTFNILRCYAIPSSHFSASLEIEESSTLPLETELSNHHVQNKKGDDHQYDCQLDENSIHDEISSITRMLKDGDQLLEKQMNLLAEESVLVLGKPGSGKTSLVQFLTGNSGLLSELVDKETGEYIIQDGVKIGTSATESFTLYPELVNYNSTITFCDSPGFHDTRSSAHEIVSMIALKSVVEKFEKTRIVLIENYGSLQYGASKDTFINLLRHVNDFVVDLDKYRESIALIASKTPYIFKTNEDVSKGIYVSGDQLRRSIAKYLSHMETSLTKKINGSISEKNKEFYNKVMRLLQSLQANKDKEGNPTRISIFRQPYRTGKLEDVESLRSSKKLLLDTIMNLKSVKVGENDFGCTLSDTAKMYLECLLKISNDEYKSKINEVSIKLGMYINTVKQNHNSFHRIVKDLTSWNENLEKLSENLDETNSYKEFLGVLHNFITTHKIPLEYKYQGQVNVLESYEKMLQKYVDTSSIFKPTAISIRQVIKSVKDDFQWYETLQKLIEELSSYNVQSNKTIISKTLFKTDDLMQDLINLLSSNDELIRVIDIQKFFEVERNEEKAAEVQLIMKSMLQDNNITCDSEGRLTVEGFYIRLSEISSEGMIRSYCNDTTLKAVAILAVDTVFIDEDTDEVFKGVNLFIAAPKWNVIGQRSIDLSGLPGKNISEDLYVDNTKNGKPGLPGSNGGSFFGIGLHFSNGEGLSIKSNGGQGGPGVDGGKGDDGKNGTNAIDKPFNENTMMKHIIRTGIHNENFNTSKILQEETLLFKFQPRYYSACKCRLTTEIDWFMLDGDCGGDGSSGGNGGEGGLGGFSGNQQLTELLEWSQIHLENQNGSRGSTGRPGEHGKNGKNGNGVAYFKIKGLEIDTIKDIYWKPIETGYSSCLWVKQNQKFSNNTPQFTIDATQPPKPTKFTDTSYFLRQYVLLFEAHSRNSVFNSTMTEFQVALKNKFSYNLNEVGLLLL